MPRIRLAPEFHDGWNNLGTALSDQKRFDEAVTAFRRALALRPDDHKAWNNLGTALLESGQHAAARDAYETSLRLRPGYHPALTNLGLVLTREGDVERAIETLRQALEIEPDHVAALNNLGAALAGQLRLDKAAACYRRALALEPDHAYAELNLAIAHLVRGEFAIGWEHYEARLSIEEKTGIKRFKLAAPRWNGEDLRGKTLFIGCEQGLGDTLQFVRLLPRLGGDGCSVIVGVPKSLRAVCAHSFDGVTEVVASLKESRRIDYQIPLLSIPRVLGLDLSNIPANVPYVRVDHDKAAIWRRHIERVAGDRLKVGLVWAGNPKHANDRDRSIAVESLAALARPADVAFFSCQVGIAQDEVSARAPFIAAALGQDFRDFSETIAAFSNLDLLISVDTAPAHAMGASGRPVWVLLPFAPDWRWLLDRTDSPWYPTMQLFRQRAPRVWDSAIASVGERLQKLVAGDRTALVPEPMSPLPPNVALAPEDRNPPYRQDRTTEPAPRILELNENRRLVRARDGLFLINTDGGYAGRSLQLYGDFGHEEARLLRQLCRPSDVAVEIGAHLGAHTVGLARHLSGGRILAFEPQPFLFQMLCANIALNGLANARCLPHR